MYSFLSKQINKSYTKSTLTQNYQKILITMSPIIPHFSNECLTMINSKKVTWPSYDQSLLNENIVNIVIQINGKKRGLIKTHPDVSEENLLNKINEDEMLFKYLDKKNIKRKIFIKNKLMNIIV